MIPIIFINTKEVPFVNLIITGEKKYETRTRNTLGGLVGRRVLIAETGHGKPVVRCSAKIVQHVLILSEKAWRNHYQEPSCIPDGSKYDWNEKHTEKHAYLLENIKPCSPFIPLDGKRHGRVWMEFDVVRE